MAGTERTGHGEARHVALLIDWENIKWATTEALDAPPDIITLKKIARRVGTIGVARAYANWADPYHEGDMERLAQQGIEPVYVLTRLYQRTEAEPPDKNSADLKLACDAMELLARNPELSAYVIVSGDGGYVHLVNRLRSHGRQVAMIGVEGTVSAMLRTVCDNVVFYDQWVTGLRISGNNSKIKETITEFQRAVEDVRQRKGDHSLAAIKAQMQRRKPEFEEEDLGIASFRHLAYLAESLGLVRIDATVEPARAYLDTDTIADSGVPLHGGQKWLQFVQCVEPGTMYTRMALVDLIKARRIYVEDRDAQALADNACDAGILWKTSTRFFDPKTQEAQGGWRYLLNPHHPRVQVYLSGQKRGPHRKIGGA